TVEAVSCDISIKRKYEPAQWNAVAARASPKLPEEKALNHYSIPYPKEICGVLFLVFGKRFRGGVSSNYNLSGFLI
ncbi:MAG TPA: hypothetical protein VM935_20335, partial [Chitinophagaceae bacterium]|nr:hypothetical protein [Chitinophagaceae bacterium]